MPDGHVHGVVWEQGTRTNLGALPGFTDSVAWGINERGQVVGAARDSTGVLGDRAYLSEQGRLVDLNDWLPEGSPWVLNNAYQINNRGYIAGGVTFNGQIYGRR